MTASERAALEALDRIESKMDAVAGLTKRETALALLGSALDDVHALRSLLSSPPPAEDAPCRCGHPRGKHGPVWRNNALLYDLGCWTLHKSDASEYCGCNRYEPDAAPPASDERPSEEQRWLTRDGTREMTPAELFRERHCAACIPGCACGKGRNEGHRDGCTHVCTHTFQRFAPAAAPAPDEGRTTEKKEADRE